MHNNRIPLWRCAALAAGALFLALAAGARAQSWETRSLLSDRGWHGIAGVQVHQPTLDADLPWVRVWQRRPVGPQYGQWIHVQVLINCDQWMQVPFLIMAMDGRPELFADVMGEDPRPIWPEPGSDADRITGAICALYGYRPPDRRPLPGTGWAERPPAPVDAP